MYCLKNLPATSAIEIIMMSMANSAHSSTSDQSTDSLHGGRSMAGLRLFAMCWLLVHPTRGFGHDGQNRRAIISDIVSKGILSAAVLGTWPLAPESANASTKDPKTGVLLPSEGEIEGALPAAWDDDDNPFLSMSSDKFSRLDSADDADFYTDPRFVEHVDENAVRTMTSYLSDDFLKPGDAVLDLCSSWTSHIDPVAKEKLGLKRVAGLGMNDKELSSNPSLTDWKVLDLNKKGATLPYDDSTFDSVICQLSIDYLTRPLETMKEVGRVMKPGGRIAVLFSNRLFIQKAVGLWTGADDIDHAYTVGAYLRYSQGGFDGIKAKDLSQRKGKARVIIGDPLYVVTAIKR